MPTDTITVSRTIKSYIQLNPYFDKSEFYKAFYELSKSEWFWLIVYYMQDSELDFISFTNHLPNLRKQKNHSQHEMNGYVLISVMIVLICGVL